MLLHCFSDLTSGNLLSALWPVILLHLSCFARQLYHLGYIHKTLACLVLDSTSVFLEHSGVLYSIYL
jgi:hypothetical protein